MHTMAYTSISSLDSNASISALRAGLRLSIGASIASLYIQSLLLPIGCRA